MQPHEIEDLRRTVEALPDESPCGLSRDVALMVLTQFKEVKLERDALLAELVAAGLG
jgi:hypothetical protein